MPHTQDSGRMTGLSVTDLFANYLDKQINAHAAGLGHAEPFGDATPHDATPLQPIDPGLAWKDAFTAAKLASYAGTFEVPAEWPTLVARQAPAIDLAFALGNFPQLVRDYHALMNRTPSASSEPTELPGIKETVGEPKNESTRLLVAGVLRLARQFDAAERMLNYVPSLEGRKVYANEAAALLWHRGQREEALAAWEAQPDSAVTHFNRGMARLFLGRRAEAVKSLTAAMALLPETSAWHHLAGLYLAMASV